ncbi:MAG: type I restriction enzyme HsdR N-terminal domain-containing protein [Desulfovibrionaceae bacterium]
MHEVSLGGTLRDYITGEEIEETTYEEFRQALARLLVEELGYPKANLRSKVALEYDIDGEHHSRALDLVVDGGDGKPLLVVIFCSGKVGSFERETTIAARLLLPGPAPLALATDTMDASLLNTRGEVLASGMQAIPRWENLLRLATNHETAPPNAEERAKLTRIFHAYCGFLVNACCGAECKGPVSGGR